MISFANASQYGNDVKISPSASVKDGMLDFVIVKEFPKWKIPFFLIKLLLGKIHLSKYVEIIKSKKMTINTNNTLIHLDGEYYNERNPITINLLAKSLKISSSILIAFSNEFSICVSISTSSFVVNLDA